MISSLNPPLEPRDGRMLRILIACRVSDPKPGKQDERSLDDQEAEHRRWIEGHTDLPYEIKVVAGSGSGESLEREEFYLLNDLVASRVYDLVLTEDLGRIARRVHAHIFCEHCVDNEVRLIALNDNVDTAIPGWQDRSIFSSWHHERSNRDTSDRIKRTHRNRFTHGGALSLPIFGYRKPAGAQGDNDLEKDPDCETILKEWFRRLDEDHQASYSEIADWLNKQGVQTGPYCRLARWTGPMVARITHNFLLKGVRFRNKRRTRRNNKSGKYRSEKAAPEDLLTRPVPHLAYFDAAYYDRVIDKVDARNEKFRRSADPRHDPRNGQPKKRTRFPGQSVYCGVCGRLFVFGGHGQKERLMCSGAREYSCWNAITFDGPNACRVITEAVYDAIESLPAFEPEFLDMLRDELTQTKSHALRELDSIAAKLKKLDRETEHLLAAIREAGPVGSLTSDLLRLEREKRELDVRRQQLLEKPESPIDLPSIEQLKEVAHEEFSRLATESTEFARLMRRLLPSILVSPVRLCDGGAIGLRASITFTAAPLARGQTAVLEGLRERLTKQLRADLFEPPQRELFRERIAELRAAGCSEREAARQLGITATAAQRAAALQRQMDSLGLTDPWLPVTEPPADYGKLRRHRHPRYRFTPLEKFPH